MFNTTKKDINFTDIITQEINKINQNTCEGIIDEYRKHFELIELPHKITLNDRSRDYSILACVSELFTTKQINLNVLTIEQKDKLTDILSCNDFINFKDKIHN